MRLRGQAIGRGDLKNKYYIPDNGQYWSIVSLKRHDTFKQLMSFTEKSPPLFFHVCLFHFKTQSIMYNAMQVS